MRIATINDYKASGLPEEGLEIFAAGDVFVISFESSDPKTFGFERSPPIKGNNYEKIRTPASGHVSPLVARCSGSIPHQPV